MIPPSHAKRIRSIGYAVTIALATITTPLAVQAQQRGGANVNTPPGGNPGPGAAIGGNPGPGGAFGNKSVQTQNQRPFIPATIPAVSEYPALERDAIAKKLDVSYRRATLGEIVGDLSRRSGLRAVYPASIERSFMVSLEANGLTPKEVLDKVAQLAKLKLDYKPEQVIISQPADDETFNKLTAKLKDKDRWVRCAAVVDLSNLGDERVAGVLTTVLNDSDPGVVAWALFTLQDHACFLPALSADRATALSDCLMARIAKPQPARPGGPLSYASIDMQLLGELQTGRAQQAVLGFLNDSSDILVQCAAANALAVSGYSDATQTLGKLYSSLKEKVAADDAERQKAHNDNWATMDPKSDEYHRRQLMGAVYNALSHSPSAEALPFIGGKPPGVTFGTGMPPLGRHAMLRQATMPFAAFRETTLRLTLAQNDDFQAFVKEALSQPEPPYNLVIALDSLSYSANNNGSANEVIAKLIANPELMKAASKMALLAPYTIGAYSKEIVDPLIQVLEKTDDVQMKVYVLNSLGTSHLPQAADELMKYLQDADPTLRTAAAAALAHTRDPRAVDSLIACLKTPSSKLEWPDLETKAMEELKRGQAVRNIPNPRRAVAAAVAATRDPKALDALLAVAQDKSVDEDARAAAAEALIGTALDSSTNDAFIARVQKLDAADQRAALHFNAIKQGISLFNMMPLSSSDALWSDARMIDLAVAHSLDQETFTLDQNNVRRNSTVCTQLQLALHPLDEHALLGLAQSDADEHLAYFAGQSLNNYGDPEIEVKMEH